MAATAMPGTFTSMPKIAEPSTFEGMSTRGCGLPISSKLLVGLR